MFKQKAPLVSVVLASYNHEKFIGEAIKSVLDQTIENIELIVVDDGSTDNTPEIAEKIGDPRVKLIKLAENRAQNPRNTGIKLARGKYIAFQNSDDVWVKDKLEKQLEEFDNNKMLAACFTAVDFISGAGKKLNKTWARDQFKAQNRPRTDWLRQFFDYGNSLCISSCMIRTSCIKKSGVFDESLFQLADLDLYIRLAAVGDLFIVQAPLTKMRIRGKQNFSYPTDDAIRRSSMEFAQVLNRYAHEPVIENLMHSFADKIPKDTNDRIFWLVYVLQYAWTKGTPHKVFADRLFAELISNPSERKKIAQHFGPSIIHEFIKRRGQLEVVIK